MDGDFLVMCRPALDAEVNLSGDRSLVDDFVSSLSEYGTQVYGSPIRAAPVTPSAPMGIQPPGMCFYHPSLPAVYICNRCGRAICRDDSKAYMDLVLCPQCYAGIVPPMAMAPQAPAGLAYAPVPAHVLAPVLGPMFGPAPMIEAASVLGQLIIQVPWGDVLKTIVPPLLTALLQKWQNRAKLSITIIVAGTPYKFEGSPEHVKAQIESTLGLQLCLNCGQWVPLGNYCIYCRGASFWVGIAAPRSA